MKKAFTIVEVLVCVCILGIVAAIIAGAVGGCSRVTPAEQYSSELNLSMVTLGMNGYMQYGGLTHNGHDFLLVVHTSKGGVCVVHHPACSCIKTAEKVE